MTAAQDSRALKPCPFCGANAHFAMDEDRWEWIECDSCGMQGNRSASLMEDCKPKLAEAWNRRAPAAPVPQIAEVQDSLVAISAAIADQDDSAAQSMLSGLLSMLAAAPQPVEAAPVQLPRPAARTTSHDGDFYWDNHLVSHGSRFGATLYTEQQVRQLLAAHGIQERST